MKQFNTTGVCIPSKHYMADISERIAEIQKLVDDGKYVTINRGRQYGKTTTLDALGKVLSEKFILLNLDFQDISDAVFKTGEYMLSFSFNKHKETGVYDVKFGDKLLIEGIV